MDKTILRLTGHKAAVRSLAFDDSGRLISGCEGGRVVVQDGPTWECGSYIMALAARGQHLAIGLMDGRVELRRQLSPTLSLRNSTGCMAVALSERWLAAGFQDGTVELVALHNLELRPGFRLKGHVTGLAFLADGTLAACSPAQDGVQLWRQDEEECCGYLDLGPRRCLAPLPAGGLAASLVCEVDFWPAAPQKTASSPIRALAANPRWVAGGCLNGTLQLWSPEGDKALTAHGAEILSLAFQGDRLASGALDGSLHLQTV